MLIKEEKKDLRFFKDDPGAVKHGNFINYYTFHSVNSRLKHLDYKMFPMPETDTIYILDVGCNVGDLTLTLYHYLRERYQDCTINILAIDIDPILIERAIEFNGIGTVEFEAGNIMEEDGKDIIRKYLEKHEKQRFDFTFCFSVTMWIHLNNGDEGLMSFLDYVQSISTSIIIEPQPWKCYKAAQKRLKRSGTFFENFDTLKIRGKVTTVIEDKILEGNFCKIFESRLCSWERTVQCYRSKDDILVHSYIANNIVYV